MKFLKIIMPVVAGLLLLAGPAVAQVQQQQQPAQADSITDTELKKFAAVANESQKVHKEMRNKVDSMLSEQNMEMTRFQEIMMSKRDPQMADSIEVTKEEEEKMKAIQPKLMEMQQKSQQEMVSIIQDNDLQPQRFQQIMQAVRTSPEVMKRFQKLAGSGSGQQN